MNAPNTHSTITTIIFDYDGVIANSDPFNLYALRKTCDYKNLAFSPEIYAQHFTGRSLRDGFKSYLLTLNNSIDLLDELVARKRSYDNQYIDRVKIYEDTHAFIVQNTYKYTYAIASSARRSLIDAFLVKYKLQKYFSVIISADDVNNGKPDPEVFKKAIESLKSSHESTIIIEDSPSGVQAATAAHIKCLAVLHTHEAKDLYPATCIGSLKNVNLDTLF